MDDKPYKIAILWRGDREARQAATPQNNRYHRIFEELAALGIDAEPAVYRRGFRRGGPRAAAEGRRRAGLGRSAQRRQDPRRARPAVARCGGARALGQRPSRHDPQDGHQGGAHRTRHLGWGADTHLYRTPAEFAAEFPNRLRAAGPRVLKQNRGNGGQGVWKVELASESGRGIVRVLEARRGSMTEELPLADVHGALRGLFRRPTAASSISRFSRACPTA